MGQLRRIKRACKHPQPIPARPQADNEPERIELDRCELEAILERARTAPISEEESAKLRAVVETLVFLTGELEKKHVSIQKLKQLLFGSATESTKKVIEKLLANTGQKEGATTIRRSIRRSLRDGKVTAGGPMPTSAGPFACAESLKPGCLSRLP
jgi:hypothetical protein